MLCAPFECVLMAVHNTGKQTPPSLTGACLCAGLKIHNAACSSTAKVVVAQKQMEHRGVYRPGHHCSMRRRHRIGSERLGRLSFLAAALSRARGDWTVGGGRSGEGRERVRGAWRRHMLGAARRMPLCCTHTDSIAKARGERCLASATRARLRTWFVLTMTLTVTALNHKNARNP